MRVDFSGLDEFVEKRNAPNRLDYVWYMFAQWGFTQADVFEMDIPYIWRVIVTHAETEKKQQQKLKKAEKGNNATI